MDIPSMEAMEDTILSFTGAAIVVTHDRYLLGRVADSLLRIHEGRAEFREGGYEDHQAWVDLDLGAEDEAGSHEPESPKKTPSPQAKPSQAVKPSLAAKPQSQPSKPTAIDKDRQRAIKRFEKQVADAEAKVADLEARLADMQKEMAAMDPADWQAFSAKLNGQKALEADLAYAMSDWEAAQGALEEAQR
jgi:ATPase subunit of ABC transporter with duplicated ATPase domains